MNDFTIAIITICATILGWFVLHYLTKRRDLHNRKKEIVIKYLINAWRNLETASNRHNQDLNFKIEESLSDIQLFGTAEEINLAQLFADDIANNNKGDSLPLLKELRKHLREELSLDVVEDNLKFIRFD